MGREGSFDWRHIKVLSHTCTCRRYSWAWQAHHCMREYVAEQMEETPSSAVWHTIHHAISGHRITAMHEVHKHIVHSLDSVATCGVIVGNAVAQVVQHVMPGKQGTQTRPKH